MSQQDWGRGNVFRRKRRGKDGQLHETPTWWLRYPAGGGKYRFESAETTDEKKARHLLSDRLAEVKHDLLPAPAKEQRRTVNSLLDAFVADCTVRKLRSVHELPSHLKTMREAFGDKRASSIGKKDLDDYITAQRDEGYAESTIGQQLKYLKLAYKLGKAKAPDFPKGLKCAIRDVLIHPAEQRRLCAALGADYHQDLAEMYFATGWRGQEIRTLRWENVREDTIHLVEEHSKTREMRDFPLTGDVAEIIARREAKRIPASPYVFHNGKGKPLGYRAWLKAWHRAAQKAGLGAVNPHDNRRAFITTVVNSGVDPQVARTLSGHKSNAIFERYRIVTTDTLKEAIEQRELYVKQRIGKVRFLADRKVGRSEVRPELDHFDEKTRKANGE